MSKSEAKPFIERANDVISDVFGGLHNAPKIKVVDKSSMIECNTPLDMSTFDASRLTVFVFSCHDNCVRGTVSGSGPRMVKLVIHNRADRDSHMYSRHPSLNEALESWRKARPDENNYEKLTPIEAES